MQTLLIAGQVAVAVGIFNVWLLRRGQASRWRGGAARTLREEFAAYGLPRWAMTAVGVLKVTFASMLLVGVWVPALVLPAALGLAVLMVGAVAMHARVGDPLSRSLPAATMLLLCLAVAGVASATA